MNKEVDVICSNDLVTFPNRKTAIQFYYNCMTCSEGSERDRYTNIYLALTGTKDKMVCDEIDYEDPYIMTAGTFVKDHCISKRLPKPMTYKEYLEYKKDKETKQENDNKYYILSIRLDNKQRGYFEDKGYYCYDIRESCIYGDGGTIEPRVIINNCGSIIINKDLKLNDKNPYIELDYLIDNFSEMSYEEFLEIAGKDKQYEIGY